MGMIGPGSTKPEPKKRSVWVTGGITILSFVALLYVIEVIDQLSGHRLDNDGIRPLKADGLWGIIWAPLLHGGWPHLIANTVPALVLGFLVTLTGLSRFVWATAIIWIVGGFGTWLIGNIGPCPSGASHIGASGLIFGWLTFLLVFGWFTRNIWEIAIGLLALFLYGGIVFGALPQLDRCTLVSWQGHLCGAAAGVFAAYLLSGPERKSRELRRRKASPPSLRS